MPNFKYTLCYILVVFFSLPSGSQNIPQEKLTDWSNAGLSAQLPVFDTINVLANGLKADGSTPNDAALKSLLNANISSPTVFYFPPGDYFFKKSIELKSNQILKGASAFETIFTFNLGGADHLIKVFGQLASATTNIKENVPKDFNVISVKNSNNFNVDDYIRIQFDDMQLVTSSWAEKSTGQILKIINKNGKKLTVASSLRRAISLSENPYIEKIRPVENAGIECLHIERQDATTTQTRNVYFQFAANCWVKGVSSHNTNFAHVDVENSMHIHVTGCYFKDAHAYGNGGQGYGVVLEYNTGDCLIDNNIFDHLRHSMLLQAGANGNVLSYNYSIKPYWEDVSLPDDSAGDLVLHGNYPYLNLFEGNIVQNIVIDDSHGINGPGNMFYRNRAEHYGIFMNDDMPTDGQSFIGNETTTSNFLLGFYDLAGSDHFEHGNNIKGNITPTGTNSINSNSLYLTAPPDYFEEINWTIPTIGPPNNLNSGSNPAKERFLKGEFTKCIIDDPVIINSVGNLPADLYWNIFPNPANCELHIESKLILENYSLKIFDLNGKIILNLNKSVKKIDISGFENGLYVLVLENEKERYFKKINILK